MVLSIRKLKVFKKIDCGYNQKTLCISITLSMLSFEPPEMKTIIDIPTDSLIQILYNITTETINDLIFGSSWENDDQDDYEICDD